MPERAEAEALALRAVEFLAQDSDRLWRFLDLTGTTPDMLRARLAEPSFLAGVLDHFLADEALLLELAGWAKIEPQAIAPCRRVLVGHGDDDS